jgi:ABC-type multidrug transport system fused ATPase/permease subunit
LFISPSQLTFCLDEATSALDPTSRSLIISALKIWRRNRTTIVITHDLGTDMISSGDFVYVMKSGSVVEQGYVAFIFSTIEILNDGLQV